MSRLIFFLGSCVLRRLQVETRGVQRVGGSESLSLDRTRCLSPGLFLKVRQEVQSLLFVRGLGVWLSPESEGALLRWTHGPCLPALF